MALAASVVTASPVLAQENRPPAPRVAPPAAYEVAPPLAAFTDEVLFGEVWRREGLAPRDRSLVTLAALIANGRSAQLRGHLGRGLDNGLRPEEISELIAQMAFYAGWPVAISAVQEAKAVFDARGIGALSATSGEPLPLDEASEVRRRAAVEESVGTVAPALADLTNRVLFGDLWRRPALAPRDRSLVTVAALVANGQAEQIPFHVNRALDAGLTAEQLSEVVTHLAFYAGWPRAMSALPVLQRVLAARAAPAGGLRVQRGDARPPTTGPAANFTGAVQVANPVAAEAPSRLGGGFVTFEPGARTVWHTHPLGQTLFVTAGCGLVQGEGGAVETIRPGDVVRIPAGLRHWHGAAPGSSMTHVAVSEAVDGNTVTWMEPVTDAQYRGGSSAVSGCTG